VPPPKSGFGRRRASAYTAWGTRKCVKTTWQPFMCRSPGVFCAPASSGTRGEAPGDLSRVLTPSQPVPLISAAADLCWIPAGGSCDHAPFRGTPGRDDTSEHEAGSHNNAGPQAAGKHIADAITMVSIRSSIKLVIVTCHTELSVPTSKTQLPGGLQVEAAEIRLTVEHLRALEYMARPENEPQVVRHLCSLSPPLYLRAC
jgi:hypothetical protein